MENLISRNALVTKLSKGYWNRELQQAKNDPCVIDAMIDWAIRIVKEMPLESPWHTGTPKEEGRYLIENIDRYNEILEWYNGHWYEEDPNSVDCRCKVSDSWVVAWCGQKIEPYKED